MKKQGDLFNLPEGERRKDHGMTQVLGYTEFKDQVRIVIGHLADRGEEFTGDDVRKLARSWGIEEPHHPNAWGAAMSAFAKRGHIRRVAHRKSAAVSRHAGMQGVWIGVSA